MTPFRFVSLLFAVVLAGCAAVYPELGTRTRPIPAGRPLDPPPPQGLYWIKFLSATVPEKTRDGRSWQSNGKATAYAKLLAGGREVLRTSAESDTLTPTWPGSPRGNFKLEPNDKLRVELWDSNPLNDKPIGSRELGPVSDVRALDGQVHVTFEEGMASAGTVELAFEPAHAVSGIGLWYELRTASCYVTRMLEGSPAERIGLQPGDEVVRIGGREAKGMTPDELQSTFNAPPFDGLKLVVRHAEGAVTEVVLREGPIYGTFAQFGPID